MTATVAWRLRPDYVERVDAAVEGLSAEGYGGQIGIVLGSGLGSVVERLDCQCEKPFAEVPGFAAVTVAAHGGKLVAARLPRGGARVLVLQGRLHAYEGLAMEEVVFPIATLLGLGVRTLILTNAAGGLDPNARAGDLLALTGLIEMHWVDPLRGLLLPTEGVPSEGAPPAAVPPTGVPPADVPPTGVPAAGVLPTSAPSAAVPAELALRAASHAQPFDRALARQLVETGAREGIVVGAGVYASLWGPAYETLGEIAFLRRMGAQAVGMSTGPEAAFAHRMGARVAGVSCVTNVAREVPGVPLTHDEVIEIGQAARERLAKLLVAFVRSLGGSGL
jgi:purine-nucleoside phosphorylase